jgi:NAD+ synthase (glutamine-hydrolysing)
LSTGNKSEMAVGYATLYGDMVGGFCVLKDVPKTLVYRLAQYRNKISSVIPKAAITRAPTAELAPHQKDSDSLPPYSILDEILKRYIELEQSITKIVSAGFDRSTVIKVINMIKRSEYKRRQSPPGVKITTNAFGRERRYPITSKFDG